MSLLEPCSVQRDFQQMVRRVLMSGDTLQPVKTMALAVRGFYDEHGLDTSDRSSRETSQEEVSIRAYCDQMLERFFTARCS